ncbi:hypothetical protein FACS1894172_21660 [Spirochaetia bacterium]|nr:hypothetical protein FACS1894172_21660 [Spirochaetia bacterium]
MNYNKIIIALFVFTTHYAMAQVNDYVIKTTEYGNGIGDIIYHKTSSLDGDNGEIWIYENNEKRILLAEYMYDYLYDSAPPRPPSIVWHNEHLVEIVLQISDEQGFGDYSWFFDFNDNTLSNKYYNPLYTDKKNEYVITFAEDGLDLYNIKTNEIIEKFREGGLFEGVQSFYYFYFNYDIGVKNNRLLFSYNYYTNDVEIHKTVEWEYNY